MSDLPYIPALGGQEVSQLIIQPESANTVGRRQAERAVDHLSVKDFGAMGDGSTDDTAAIQAAIDAVILQPIGGTVFFPGGSYIVSSTIIVHRDWIFLQGDGFNSSRLVRASGWNTGHTVSFSQGGGADPLFFGGIENIQFLAQTAMTSGAHLHLLVCRDFMVRNCWIREGFVGIQAISCGALRIESCEIKTGNLYPTGGSEAFAYLYFDTDLTATIARNGAYVSRCNFRSEDDTDPHVDFGIYISSADGIWLDQVHVGNTAMANIVTFPESNSQLSGLNLDNCFLDRCTGAGLLIDGESTAVYGNFLINDCNFAGGNTGDRGLSIQPDNGTVQNIQIRGSFIRNFTSHGFFVDNCTNFSFCDNDIRNVGITSGSSMTVQSGATNGRIQGNSAGFLTDGVTTSGANYGLAINGAGHHVADNDLRGNSLSAINDNGVTNSVFHNNRTGTALIAVASAATITCPVSGDVFSVTGTTTITSITASWPEREIKIIFGGVLTLTDGSNLALAGDFVTTSNDTITLVSNGTGWVETARSVN